MNVLGVGGLELVVVMLIALFVVGPVRLVEGARTARKYLEEIRRQRDELTQMIEDAADLEGVKAALDQDGLIGEVRQAASELTSFRDEAVAASDDLRELQDVAATLRRPLGNRPSTDRPAANGRDGAAAGGGAESGAAKESEDIAGEPASSAMRDAPSADGARTVDRADRPAASANGAATDGHSLRTPAAEGRSPTAPSTLRQADATPSQPSTVNGAATTDHAEPPTETEPTR